MQKIRIIILIILLCLPASAERVCSVHDGDTLTTCEGESIRFWGIDAPELKQPLGTESRDYLKRLVTNRNVNLDCVGKSFQRRVCRVSVRLETGSVLSLQNELVGRGLAYDSPGYSKGRYAQAEGFAHSLSRGVWALPGGGVRPWDYRSLKKSKPLQ